MTSSRHLEHAEICQPLGRRLDIGILIPNEREVETSFVREGGVLEDLLPTRWKLTSIQW